MIGNICIELEGKKYQEKYYTLESNKEKEQDWQRSHKSTSGKRIRENYCTKWSCKEQMTTLAWSSWNRGLITDDR